METKLVLGLILVILPLCCFIVVSHGESPMLTISQGELKGVYLKSRDGNTYSAFMGIPYADKPDKFELSVPASKWDGIKDATKFGSVCPQLNIYKQQYDGDEDCLFANVFTPNIKGDFPVMIFIHGGGFFFGNSNENGADYFMDEEVVFVTINYRLSALGFLSTGDNVLPGNLGLKDQLLSLKWVQQNIKYFGGDPKRVTLFGESAGAASVSYHVLSPGSKGLFRSAICQSGTALNSWAYVENPKIAAFKLAKKLNCPTDSIELKKCLKSKSVEDILKNTMVGNALENLVVYAPTVEPPSPHAIITEHPEVLYKTGRFNKIPMVMTVCEKEGLLINSAAIMKDEKLIKELNEKWMKVAPSYFLYDDPTISQETKDLISKRTKKFYFGDKEISLETFDNLTNVYSDSYFIYGVRNTALIHGKHAPVYPIILGFEGYEWSQIMKLGYEKPLGMTHADDLPFLFSDDQQYPKFIPKSLAETASKYFVKSCVAMATQGDPNINHQVEGWVPVSEGEIKSGNLKWLFVKKLVPTPTMVEEPVGERMRFWDKVNKKLRSQKDSKKEEL